VFHQGDEHAPSALSWDVGRRRTCHIGRTRGAEGCRGLLLIGYLGSASPGLYQPRLRAFHEGLAELGFVEGRITNDTLFIAHAGQLAELTLRHSLPAAHQAREFAAAGGFLSYGGSFAQSHHEAGVYVGRILKGKSQPIAGSAGQQGRIDAQFEDRKDLRHHRSAVADWPRDELIE
jgi:hypothetical protein